MFSTYTTALALLSVVSMAVAETHTIVVGGQTDTFEVAPGGYWFAAVEKGRWPDNPETREWIDGNWEEVGDCRQEIVFIGVSMKKETIERVLDDALVTEEEMNAGTEHWFTFDDPLPEWAV